MFRIGEFSKLTQVSIRMLRYYDEAELLKPAQIDKFTGYRLYSVEQIPILNRIVFLRDTGFNVAEIAAALNQWDDESIKKQLQNKSVEIKCEIQAERKKQLKIEKALKEIEHEKLSIHYNFSIKHVPSYQVISLRKVISDYFAEGQLWEELSNFIKVEHISTINNNFAIYHDQEYKEADVDVEVCTVVENPCVNKAGFTYRNTERIETMACTMVYGAFENIAGAYLSFANWLQQHNQFDMTGQNRQIVHRGPWNEENQDKYLTEIQIPVKNR
jgi:DNA-binding transcriptional MerR regulator/effector-binding domain-containing protein